VGINYLDRSAVILAGGASKGFNEDKGVLELNGKPLLNHIIDAVKGLVDEIIVVTSTQQRADSYAKMLSVNVRFAVDIANSKGPLIGALTGFEVANGEYALILPFDSPFVSREVVSLLFELCVGKSAVIPRRTNMEIEALHAVYNVKHALIAAQEARADQELELDAMVERLRGVRYVSTLVIEQLDPDLRTFFTINTPLDLQKAVVMSKPEGLRKRS
jgi:molybdopterin-guanine dinucleotide biosynthesis protein A